MNEIGMAHHWRLVSNNGSQLLSIEMHSRSNGQRFDFRLGMCDELRNYVGPRTEFRCCGIQLNSDYVEGFVRHVASIGNQPGFDDSYSETTLANEKGFKMRLAIYRDGKTRGVNTGLSEVEVIIEHGNAKSETRFSVDPISIVNFGQDLA